MAGLDRIEDRACDGVVAVDVFEQSGGTDDRVGVSGAREDLHDGAVGVFAGGEALLIDPLDLPCRPLVVGGDDDEADSHQAEHGQEREHNQENDPFAGRASMEGKHSRVP